MARDRDDADRGQNAGQREQNRDADRDERPQHDQKHGDRDRNGALSGELQLIDEQLVERLVRADAGVAHVESGMPLGDGLRPGRDRVDRLFGLIGVAAHLPLHRRGAPVVADLTTARRSVRRMQVLDRVTSADGRNHVRDGRAECRIVNCSSCALDEHELRLRRALGECLLQKLVGLVRLSDAGVIQFDLLEADQLAANGEADKDGGDPSENGRLPVRGAPGAHAAGDVHRPLHLGRCQVGRRPVSALGRRLVLNHTRVHLDSSVSCLQPPTACVPRVRRAACGSGGGFLASC